MSGVLNVTQLCWKTQFPYGLCFDQLFDRLFSCHRGLQYVFKKAYIYPASDLALI